MIPVILSGGSGSRLWPLSRKLYPKQFLALTSEQTMFQETINRLGCEGSIDCPIIVCNAEHRYLVEEQLKAVECKPQALIMEPFGRNTAPAVAIAAMQLVADGKDDLMLVLPADHVIEDEAQFKAALQQAAAAAERGEMVLFGIPATAPETGYGYIKTGSSDGLPEGVARVERFVEKPDAVTATEYVTSGDYCWNSGIFLFRASRFLEELKKHDTDIYDTCLLALERSSIDGINISIDAATFAVCPDNSIDYAVMEKTTRACVVPMSAGWNDVGSWSALWDVHAKDSNGNVLKGDVVLHDSRNCLVHGNGKLVTLVGLDDVVVVETKDAVMIAHKDKVQDVKKLVSILEKQDRKEVKAHQEVFRPWGCYDSIDMGQRFQVKRITVKPGAQLSLQMHHHRAEHWIVVSGTAEVTCDDKVFLLTENQSTYLPMTSVHRLANPGKVPLELIEVQSGGYLGEDDIVRFEDIYGRVDTQALEVAKAGKASTR